MKSTGQKNRKQPSVVNYLPSWTPRGVLEATGRDPLGLAQVSGISLRHQVSEYIPREEGHPT